MKKSKKKLVVVDETKSSGRCVYQIKDLQNAKALRETTKKMLPNKKFYLSDFL